MPSRKTVRASLEFSCLSTMKIREDGRPIFELGHGSGVSPPVSVLRVGWGLGLLVVMAVVEDLADPATCALNDFACALGGTDADVFAGDACAFADVFRGPGGVEGGEIAGAFADAFGCRSCSFSSALADVAGSAADVTARAAGLGLGLSLGGSLG
jgi:hypothetical protein